jgi:hypothetical protein
MKTVNSLELLKSINQDLVSRVPSRGVVQGNAIPCLCTHDSMLLLPEGNPRSSPADASKGKTPVVNLRTPWFVVQPCAEALDSQAVLGIGGPLTLRSDSLMFEACVRLDVQCSERIMLVQFSTSLGDGGFAVRGTWLGEPGVDDLFLEDNPELAQIR